MAPELLRALHNKRLTPRLCCVYRIVLGRFFKFRWASLLGAKTARCTFEQHSYTQRGRASKNFPLYFHFRRNINQEKGESFPGFLFFFSFSNSLFVVPKFLERDSISKRRVVCGPRQPAKLGKVCSLLLCSLWSFWRVCVCDRKCEESFLTRMRADVSKTLTAASFSIFFFLLCSSLSSCRTNESL